MPKVSLARAKVITDLKSEARGYTDVCLRALVTIASSSKMPPQARVSAASVLLDRGWGKAASQDSIDGAPEFRIIIRRVLDEAEANIIEHQPSDQ